MGTFARTSFANKVSFCSNSSEFLNLSCFGPYTCECVASYNLIKFNYKIISPATKKLSIKKNLL